MATREILRKSLRLNLLNKFRLNVQKSSTVVCKKGLHTIVSPCHAATTYKGCGKEQFRSIASYEYSEGEGALDNDDGNFDKYNISEVSQKKLREMGIQKLLPVQYHTYAPTIEGKDVIVQARTGTGKTLSFALPIVEKLEQNMQRLEGGRRTPMVIVLTPTRELANQIKEVFDKLCERVKVACVYGGVNIETQISTVQRGVDVVVGTPGRVNDLMRRNVLGLKNLKHVILDEVDRMLDMGFADQVEEIIIDSYKPGIKPQTMLYSATMPSWVRNAARKYLDDDYQLISLIGKNSEQTATTVKQYAMKCMESQKPSLITYFVKNFCQKTGRAMVFCQTKKEVDHLTQGGLICSSRAFHGDIAQASRDIILKDFKKGTFQVLVTTDVAARGLDIPDVDIVIQSSPPKDTSYYIHRVGRTGRAGKSGISILMYTKDERSEVNVLEGKANVDFEHLSPPTLNDMTTMCLKDVTNEVLSVPDELTEKFMKTADMLMQQEGAQKMLAASLAVASGAKKLFFRSQITFQEGFITLRYKRHGDVRFLQEKLGTYFGKMNVKYQNLHRVSDNSSLVFDVKAEDVRIVLEGFENIKASDNESIEQVSELPDIIPVHRHGDRFSFPRNNSWSTDRHGSGSFRRQRGMVDRDNDGSGFFRRHRGMMDRNDDGYDRFEQRDRHDFRERFNKRGGKFDFDRNKGDTRNRGRQDYEWDSDEF